MALTQSAWTITSVNNRMVAKCTVLPEATDTDAYTLKTPGELDATKPWSLGIQFAATPDAQALPVDLWVGYSDSFALSGQGGSVVATVSSVETGAKFKQIIDDIVLAVAPLVYVFNFDPDLAVADVVTAAAVLTGLKVKIPVAPYYAIAANGGSTLAATTATYTIIQ